MVAVTNGEGGLCMYKGVTEGSLMRVLMQLFIVVVTHTNKCIYCFMYLLVLDVLF